MIYCDGVHLVSDESLEELHAFAKDIGIKKCWFHSSSRFPHYDIPKRRRKTILETPGITTVSPRQIVAAIKIMETKWKNLENAAFEMVKNFGSYNDCECDYCTGVIGR